MNADPIEQLPLDKSNPSHNEIQLLDMVFKQEQSTISKVASEMKIYIVLVVLYVLLALPQFDEYLSKLLPSISESFYMITVIKGFLLMITFYFISNLYTVRK